MNSQVAFFLSFSKWITSFSLLEGSTFRIWLKEKLFFGCTTSSKALKGSSLSWGKVLAYEID